VIATESVARKRSEEGVDRSGRVTLVPVLCTLNEI